MWIIKIGHTQKTEIQIRTEAAFFLSYTAYLQSQTAAQNYEIIQNSLLHNDTVIFSKRRIRYGGCLILYTSTPRTEISKLQNNLVNI